MLIRKIKDKKNYIIGFLLFFVFSIYYLNSSLASPWFDPGDSFGSSGLLFNPSIEIVDMIGFDVTDSTQVDFSLDPYATTGIRIGGSSYAADLEGNTNIDGYLSISGVVIGTASSLFIKFPDTPDEYLQMPGVGDWEHRTTVTVDRNKVIGSFDKDEFPLMIKGTYWFLRSWANGGHVRHNSGYDLMFSMNSDGSTPLSYELEHYDPATGTIVVWVNVDLNVFTDTRIYMFYGNQTISTDDEEDVDGTWSSYYKLVNHMENGSDSSGSNNTATFGHTPDVRDGLVHKAQYLDGDDDYMRVNDSQSIRGSDRENTVSAWIKVDDWSNDSNDYSYIAGKGNWGGKYEYRLYHRGDGNIYWEVSVDGTSWKTVSIPDSAIPTGEWHLLSATFNDSAGWMIFGCWFAQTGYLKLYVDGEEIKSESFAGCTMNQMNNDDARFAIGSSGDNGAGGAYNDDFEGIVDEVWFEEELRDSDWMKTMYNNYSDPDSFYDIVISNVGHLVKINSAEDALEFDHVIEGTAGVYHSLWDENIPNIYFNTGKVGINTGVATPSELLHIKSDASADNAEINIQSGSNDYWAIYNDESSNDFRFWNSNHSSGIDALTLYTDGKVSLATSSASLAHDFTVVGDAEISQSADNNTFEVYNTAASGIAVYGQGHEAIRAVSTEADSKVISGEADAPATVAVYGLGPVGVRGQSLYALGNGVEGKGGMYGGYFETSDANSSGAYGLSSSTFAGVWGLHDSSSAGAGVRGDGPYGVYGITNGKTNTAGIFGSGAGYSGAVAGYFEGDVVLGEHTLFDPVYVDLYDDATAPASAECEVTYNPAQAIKIQRGTADIGSNGGTDISPVDFEEFSSLTSTFVLNSNNRYMNGGQSSQTNNDREVDDMSGGLALTGTDTISFYRDSGSRNSNFRFQWEAWEYIGDAGGPNEFIVRGRYVADIASGSRTRVRTISSSCSDRDKCIPFITGVLNSDPSNDLDNATAFAHMSADNQVTVERGGGTDTTRVYGVVVEFTGSNWSVAHGKSANSNADAGTIYLYEESVGTGGTTYNVSDWDDTIIFHQFKADDNSSNEDPADTSAVYYPGVNDDEVYWAFDAQHFSVGSNEHMIHILENSDMAVSRYSSTAGSQGTVSINVAGAGLTDLSNSAVVGSYNSGDGAGDDAARGFRNIYLHNLTTVYSWSSRSDDGEEHRVQVIEMPMDLVAAGGGAFGRMMLETTNHLLYVCTDSGWSTVTLNK